MKRLIALTLGLVIILAACSPEDGANGVDPPDNTGNSGGGAAVTDDGYIALRIGGVEISGAEYRYHYYSTVQSFVNIYGLYMGIDMDTPFDEQIFDGDVTWADLFEEQALLGLQNSVLLSEQAKKEGMELMPVFGEEIDNRIDEIKLYYSQNGEDFASALTEYYGAGIDEAALRAVMERIYLGYQYEIYKRGSFEISAAAIDEYYNVNADEYDEVDYLSYVFMPEFGDDGYTVVDSARAQEDSAAFLAAVTDGDSFRDYISDVLGDDPDYYMVTGGVNDGDPVSAWLYDVTRVEGDKAVIESDDFYHVLYFIRRYLPADTALSIRHALVSSEGTTAGDAREKAALIYDEWKSGPANEKSFAEMAMSRSQDPGSAFAGGLYEDVQPGQMVEPFDAWCFDASRSHGDTGLVDTQFGTHIMFYVGYVEVWKNRVRLAIGENDYEDFYGALLPAYEVAKINMDVSR